jgi:hypothetical protein
MLPGDDSAQRIALEEIVEAFESAWQSGPRPRVEDFLEGDRVSRQVLLWELVHADLDHRLRAGETARVEDYMQRFAEIAANPERLAELIIAEFRHRKHLKQQANVDEYRERFPHLFSQCQEQLFETATAANETPSPLTSQMARPEGLPERVGRYRVEQEIDRGGMGVVVRVRDEQFDRPLALKVVQARYRGDTELEERFVREAKLTGQIQHPGVPPVQEMGQLPDGRPFFIMKLVKGSSLQELLDKSPAPKPASLVGMFRSISETLAYAHSRRVLHRDLKPGNVMVGAFGEVQVMDWGLAKVLTEGGQLPAASEAAAPETVFRQTPISSGETKGGLGTPAYMAPEQARGEALGFQCDVFGLGGILCAILTGKPPFAGSTWEDNRRRAMKGDLADAFRRLDSSGEDGDLIQLAKRCLAPEPSDRPKNAHEVAVAVAEYESTVRERLRQAELERARAEVQAAEEQKRRLVERQKRRTVLMAAGTVFVILLTGAAALGWFSIKEYEAEQSAEKRLQQLVNVYGLVREIFHDLDPDETQADGDLLRALLRSRLDLVAEKLDEEVVGDTLIVASLQDTLGAT